MAIKKVLLQKKIEGVVYDIYQKTSADVVVYDETYTVASKIAELAGAIEDITEDDGTIDAKIKAESEALYNKIMGFTDADKTIAEAYDTLKEVATYLDNHGEVVAGFTSEISAIKDVIGVASADAVGTPGEDGYKPAVTATGLMAKIETIESDIAAIESDVEALKETVGDEESGLVKAVAANTAAIGDEESGLISQVAALEAVAATKVEASETNGNIVIDGEDTVVYTHPETHAATMITEDDDHKFVTADEKTAWNANAEIIVASSAPEDLDETDLLMLVIG